MAAGNLLEGLPDAGGAEVFEALLERPGCRIERIVSRGQASPPGFWYDEDGGEWVVVIKGRAVLRLAAGDRRVELGPGDFIDLPPRCRHRVEWTEPDADTVWLAVHY